MVGERKLRYEYVGGIAVNHGALYYGADGTKSLLPCQRIVDPDIQVGILGYGRIQAQRLLPAHKDRQPIRLVLVQTGEEVSVTYPGKSAFLYFDGIPTADSLGKIVSKSLSRIREVRDHLHLSTVAWIEEAGWQVWWTPLPEREHWLHARLIPNCVVERGVDPTLDDARALKEVFIKAL